MSSVRCCTLLPLSFHSSAAPQAQLTSHLSSDPGRVEVERFIHRCFAAGHQADIQHYLPELLVLRDSIAQPLAAAGLRLAEDAELFLERYLDEPAHHALARLHGCTIERRSVVEVGNLASLDVGSARLMITLVTWLLAHRGLQWVTFTGAASLVNSFRRLGLQPSVLGLADPHRLAGEQVQWGRYYSQRPQVLAGNIAQGYAALAHSGLFRRLGLSDAVEAAGHAA